MKKKVGNLLFVITALLCVFVLSGQSSIVSKAAEIEQVTAAGTLLNGEDFCSAIKSLANGVVAMDYKEKDEKVKKIVFLAKGKKLDKQKSISVGDGVTAYYDGKGTISISSATDKIAFNKSSSAMFYNFQQLTEIDFGKGRIDTSKSENMSDMFYENLRLKSLDLRDFNTSTVYTMDNMFEYCQSLETVNLSKMNTARVGSMAWMFSGCYSLKELDLSSFKTDYVCSMQAMFQSCKSLKKLEIKHFNTKNLAVSAYMFSGCESLETLDLPNFGSSEVIDIERMFQYCKSLKSLNLPNFTATNVYRADGIFCNCNNLEYLDIRSLDLSNVYETRNILSGCYGLKTIFVPKATKSFLDFFDLMVIDNNGDGKPDTAETFHKNPISDRANRMIPFDDATMTYVAPVDSPSAESRGTAEITENGVTYRLGSDGSAIVTKITGSGKVSINTVTYRGKTYSVKEIAASACKDNKSIKSITIGKNVTSIGKDSFKGCKNLKKITISVGKSLKFGKGAFKKISKKATIKVTGIKGKQKTKLVNAIKKQTNAKVK